MYEYVHVSDCSTRSLCESWGLLTCIYIISCIFLGPREKPELLNGIIANLIIEHAIIEQNW